MGALAVAYLTTTATPTCSRSTGSSSACDPADEQRLRRAAAPDPPIGSGARRRRPGRRARAHRHRVGHRRRPAPHARRHPRDPAAGHPHPHRRRHRRRPRARHRTSRADRVPAGLDRRSAILAAALSRGAGPGDAAAQPALRPLGGRGCARRRAHPGGRRRDDGFVFTSIPLDGPGVVRNPRSEVSRWTSRRFSAAATSGARQPRRPAPADDQDSLRTYLWHGRVGPARRRAGGGAPGATPRRSRRPSETSCATCCSRSTPTPERRRAAPVHPRPRAGARRAERRQRPTSSVAISSAALSRPVRSRTTRTREQYSAYTGRSQPPSPQE